MVGANEKLSDTNFIGNRSSVIMIQSKLYDITTPNQLFGTKTVKLAF